MSTPEELESAAADVAAEIAEIARADGYTVAVAESLTGGKIAVQFAAAPGSSEWFAGGVVSYQSAVKHSALGVPEGPVISETAVRAMADGVARLMGADAVIAASGAGGPGEQEDNPPGTTWLAVDVRGRRRTALHRFEGEPIAVLARTQDRALRLLRDTLREHRAPGNAR